MWLKTIYPLLSGLIEKIPPRRGQIVCNCMIVFMIFNMILSALALARYTERNSVLSDGSMPAAVQDVAASGNARTVTPLEAFLDSHFPDERMERIYPNAKMVE